MSNIQSSSKIRPEIKEAAARYVHKLFMHSGDSNLVNLLKKEAFKRVYKQMIQEPDSFLPKTFSSDTEPWDGRKPEGPADFLKGPVTLPSLPQIQMQLQRIIDDPNSTISDLAKLICREPKLSAAVMRLANSGLYKQDKPVETPSKALELLGFEKAGGLALGTASLSLFKRTDKTVLDLVKFWKHSIACGVVAQEIAVTAELGDPERFFAGGLLHDIGLHVIFESNYSLGVELFRLANSDGYNLYKAERKMLGFNHADLGGCILEKWKFPRQLVAAAGGHHNPRKIESDPDAMVIHVADFIAQALGYELGISPVIGFIDQTAWDKIGITAEQLIELLPNIQRLIDDVLLILED
ncbi:HDOD domain-containing protein [Maridesulfovibrio salexigens]|uniref:Metal dependent phosphohydrolase n=1 Tax=Maridesulfovibrio salexigens (strain ATCC 14822 / DSM 2638 / NCIMB 8403 / VKM B-1763) TaxID=526222 RepID=C6BZ97_MARSD|nr:HDOD domain-containing protein [Maridesulfovibrio salexigens]ACS80734.1 metal dependent phosphohydrolase [Maridesulfovibrio salexigens DSM 2638]